MILMILATIYALFVLYSHFKFNRKILKSFPFKIVKNMLNMGKGLL